MANPSKATASTAPECTCGPLTPQKDDLEINDGTPASEVLAKVRLLCDDNPGVFFFLYNQKLYLRVVEEP